MNDVKISAEIKKMSFKERKDGRWEGRLSIDGNRKSFYGKTKVEVKQKAREYLQKVANGYREPKKILLNDFVEYWLKNYKLNRIEPSSYTRLYRVYECQIKNTLGMKVIGSISTADIQKLIDNHANPADDKTKPLALSGLKKILHLLGPCLQVAVIEGLISENPCDNVLLPIESCIKTKTKKQITMSDAEIEEFKREALARYKTTNEYCSRDAIVLLIVLNLGLRVGEVTAWEWNDIDFEKGITFINKTVQNGIKNFSDVGNRTYTLIKDSTKTVNGERILKLNDTVMFYLRELQAYDKRKNIVSKYVCCTNRGTQGIARNLQRSLDRLIKKTNIHKNITLHTLRHTFGSVMIRRGVGVEIVSKLMGHANIMITYTKYIHVLQEQQVLAMQTVKVC